MKSVYADPSIATRLQNFFESMLIGFTRPTRRLLALIASAILAVGMIRSVRDVYRRYLAKVNGAQLTGYYNALSYAVDKRPHTTMRRAATLAMDIIPEDLKDYPVMLLTDDTMVGKFGRKFEEVTILFDHAAHDGKPYKNAHVFVSLMLAVPVGHDANGKVAYLAVPLEHRMWKKDGDSKLQIAYEMVREVLPALERAVHILVLCDSWYTKQPFLSVRALDDTGRIEIIGAARSDTFMCDPEVPGKTGKRGRPRIYGEQIHIGDFELTAKIGKEYVAGSRKVRTKLFGACVVTAVVTARTDGKGSRRLFISTVDEDRLAQWMHLDTTEPAGTAMDVYHIRWLLEMFYEVGKGFWQMGDYMLRSTQGIERLVNLISLSYASALLLPYSDEDFAYLQGMSPQDVRFEIGMRLREEQFSAGLLSELEKKNTPPSVIQAVQDAICSMPHAA